MKIPISVSSTKTRKGRRLKVKWAEPKDEVILHLKSRISEAGVFYRGRWSPAGTPRCREIMRRLVG